MRSISQVDAKLKSVFNCGVNSSYMPARKLAEAAINNKLVSIKAIDSTDATGNKPLKIWLQMTTPGHVYMTSQGGKLVWTEAVKPCTEERFIDALRETYLHLERHHHEDEKKELELYKGALRRRLVGRDKMPSVHIKRERLYDEGSIDLDTIPLIDLD